MGTLHDFGVRSRWTGAGLAAAVSLLLPLTSCTGSIDDAGGGNNPSNPGGNPGPGNGGAVKPPPGPSPGNPTGMEVPFKPTEPLAPFSSMPSETSRFARLNHAQWESTVRDLLRIPDTGLSGRFTPEPLISAFDNNGGVLSVSKELVGDYQTDAETLATKIARDAKLLAAVAPATPTDIAGRSKAFVQSFGLRAFRRPLTDVEVTRYLEIFNKGPMLVATNNAFADGVEMVLQAMLQSSNFLYRSETSTAVTNGRVLLNDYEIASRLSYGLIGSMPDDQLFMAAASKQLATRDGVLTQAKRLLATDRAKGILSDFHAQLLRMQAYDGIQKTSPLFPLGIGTDLKQEAMSFVQNVVFDQSKGWNELLTAPYTFANTRLAAIYGIPTPAGASATQYTRANLDAKIYSGLLTQPGFLSATSEGTLPNSIIRGVHVAKDILCAALPPPPQDVPPFPPSMPGSTNRKRVEDLTSDAGCAGCHHVFINPLGFAFENFDGMGKYRTMESSGLAIDAKATYNLDGTPVTYNGAAEFLKNVAGSKQAHDCFAEHLAEYIYGRDFDRSRPSDTHIAEEMGLRSKANVSVKDLVLNLVATDAFLTRLP